MTSSEWMLVSVPDSLVDTGKSLPTPDSRASGWKDELSSSPSPCRAPPRAKRTTPKSPVRARILHQRPGKPDRGDQRFAEAGTPVQQPNGSSTHQETPAAQAGDTRQGGREYEQAQRKTPERREYRRRYADEQRQRARLLGKCQKCSKPAIPGQSRCFSCAEAHRQSPRRSYAKRRAAVEETAGRQERRVKPKVSLLAQEKGDTSLIFQVSP